MLLGLSPSLLDGKKKLGFPNCPTFVPHPLPQLDTTRNLFTDHNWAYSPMGELFGLGEQLFFSHSFLVWRTPITAFTRRCFCFWKTCQSTSST